MNANYLSYLKYLVIGLLILFVVTVGLRTFYHMLKRSASPEQTIFEGARDMSKAFDGMDRRLNALNSAFQSSFESMGSLAITGLFSFKAMVVEPATLGYNVLKNMNKAFVCRKTVITQSKYCAVVYIVHLFAYLTYCTFYSVIYTALGMVSAKKMQFMFDRTCTTITSRMFRSFRDIGNKDSSGYVIKAVKGIKRCYSCESRLIKDEHKNKYRDIKSNISTIPTRMRRSISYFKDVMRHLRNAV
jgi:hypothetical protein